MLYRLWLRLRGDIVGALVHERNEAMSVFISAKEQLRRVVAGLDARIVGINAEVAELQISLVEATAESDKTLEQLDKLNQLF